jgi:hypothetical protein
MPLRPNSTKKACTIQHILNVFRLARSVLLSLVDFETRWNILLQQCLVHNLGLIRRYNLVFVSLLESNRIGQDMVFTLSTGNRFL